MPMFGCLGLYPSTHEYHYLDDTGRVYTTAREQHHDALSRILVVRVSRLSIVVFCLAKDESEALLS